MSDKPATFTVTDRRKKFDLDDEPAAPTETAAPATPPAAEPPAATTASGPRLVTSASKPSDAPAAESQPDDDLDAALGVPPTAAETAEQHAAYRTSSAQVDDLLRQANPGETLPGPADFEQLVQSIYVSAAIALGAGTEPGQKPRIDLLGARQSIDMLDVLSEKTTGNLNEREKRLLDGALFNVRMMFLEITNAISAQAHRPPAGPKK